MFHVICNSCRSINRRAQRLCVCARRIHRINDTSPEISLLISTGFHKCFFFFFYRRYNPWCGFWPVLRFYSTIFYLHTSLSSFSLSSSLNPLPHVPTSYFHPYSIILFTPWSSYFTSAGIVLLSLLSNINFYSVWSPTTLPTPCFGAAGCLS